MKTQGSPIPQGECSRGSAVARARHPAPVVLSFDVEEHDRIEAASGLTIGEVDRKTYRERMVGATEWILEQINERGVKATFFIVGDIALHCPSLVRRIHDEGHEVACHSWAHQRIHRLDRESFQEDTLRSKSALEQVIGERVSGYRAPTFSITRETAWAVDVLVELGFEYDSSIFPIRHDRYGIPDAPREPFLVRGSRYEILELPPATLRVGRVNLPVGGGGYFRLLPGPLNLRALKLAGSGERAIPLTLYFHPWEFDPGQPRLPLRLLSRWRTYVGIGRTRQRLSRLLGLFPCQRAIDLARLMKTCQSQLPRFALEGQPGEKCRSDSFESPV